MAVRTRDILCIEVTATVEGKTALTTHPSQLCVDSSTNQPRLTVSRSMIAATSSQTPVLSSDFIYIMEAFIATYLTVSIENQTICVVLVH